MFDARANERRRQQILAELATLRAIRRGSVTDQTIHVRGRDGRPHPCGPYPLYTFKEGNRTTSKRLPDAEAAATCRQQIEAGRRFRDLVRELMQLGEAYCEGADADLAQKKRPRPISRSSSKPRSSSGR